MKLMLLLEKHLLRPSDLNFSKETLFITWAAKASHEFLPQGPEIINPPLPYFVLHIY